MNVSERRKLVLFITCLSIAIVAWLFFALSNRYMYVVATQIHYTNPPQEKAFHSLQSDTVSLQIEGTGWQLMFSKMRILPRSINVNLEKLSTKNYVTFSEQLREINSQLGLKQRVVSVIPDTLYFDFSSRSIKKVPVRLSYNLQYKKRYNISGPIEINPQYIIVNGTYEDIAHISYWPTDSLKVINAEADISAKVSLMHSPKPNVSIYPNIVHVKIPVGEFTEKSLEIPLKVLNNRYEVKLLPEKVKITFLTSLNNYPRIDRESIEATIDMNYWETKGYPQLPVKLLRFPAFCKLISIEPQVIDFIIQ